MIESAYTVWMVGFVGLFGLVALIELGVTVVLRGAAHAAGEDL